MQFIYHITKGIVLLILSVMFLLASFQSSLCGWLSKKIYIYMCIDILLALSPVVESKSQITSFQGLELTPFMKVLIRTWPCLHNLPGWGHTSAVCGAFKI